MGPPIASCQATPTAVRRFRQLTAALLTLLAAAALGGCGGSKQPGGAGGATATTAAPAPTVTAPTTTKPAVLADGRHPVYLKRVDADKRTITFDLIQFFTGEAAAKAAAEDGKESPPPNDYYIRNVNPRLRTLPVGDDATITANQVAGSNQDVPVTLDKLASLTHGSGGVFWITVQHGQIVKISQQWLP